MPRVDDKLVRFDYAEMSQFSHEELGLYCLSEWDIVIIKSCLRFASWPTRWHNDGIPLKDYDPIKLDQSIGQAELIDWRLSMSACEDLQAAITNLAAILGSGTGGCGCGTSGTGEDVGPSSEDTGDIFDDGQTPPPGFATWADYQDYKCDVADYIISSFRDDVVWLQTQNLVGLAIGALIIGLLLPVPGSRLVAMLALLVAIGGLGAGALANLEDAITNNYDALVCFLYTASNASEAKADLLGAMNNFIDAESSDQLERYILKQLIQHHINFVALNWLFEKDDAVAGLPLNGDCSSCLACSDTLYHGTGDFGTLDFASTPDGAYHHINFHLGSHKNLHVDSITGYTHSGSGVNDFRIQTNRDVSCGDPPSGWDLYNSDTNPTGQTFNGVGEISFNSSTAFSIELSQV